MKKLLSIILTIVTVMCCAYGLAACKGDTGNDNTDDDGNVYTVETVYAAAKELGFGGTLEEFVETIKGKDGKDGINGKDGADGKDGVDGKDGLNGADGVGVKDAHFNENGELILVLTDGNTLNCGKVVAPDNSDQLQYVAVKENGEITGYSVVGLGTVTDTDIIIPSVYRDKPVVSIASYAFNYCGFLTSVVIPDSVTFIDTRAFNECWGLKSVTIGNGVKEFARTAFYGCEGLEKVNITDLAAWCSIKFNNEANYLLYYANNLYLNGELVTQLKIPDGVTSIGRTTFSHCNAITSVIIPESVIEIDDAFDSCNGIQNVYYEGSEENWNKITINIDPYSGFLYATRYYYSETQPSSSGNYWHYDENGEIVVWKKETV